MPVNPVAIGIFGVFVVATLLITYWASRRSATAENFYAAGGEITAPQNAMAMAGDYLSAAAFLGTVAVFFGVGVSGLLYTVGSVAGWPIALFLVGERLRKLGRYSFSDVLANRLADRPVRVLAAVSALCITASYLVAQMVGAGTLVQILFNIPYRYAVTLVGVLIMAYVVFGGMLAATWIQVIKATLLLLATVAMVLLVLTHWSWNVDTLFGAAVGAQKDPSRFMRTGQLVTDPISSISLGLAFALGPAGLPHVLMRFFTVKDGATARRSLAMATFIIAAFQIMVVVLGYAAAAFLTGDSISGGANMAAVHLAHELGGDALLGVIAAVSFATILAVASGLLIAGASAVSHDLFNHILMGGRATELAEIRVSRMATVLIACTVTLVAMLCEHENIGFLATLPLAVAASVNFPVLILAMHWRGLTTRGAVAGGYVGLLLSVLLILGSKAVWVDILGHSSALLPYQYPTLFSLTAAVLVALIASVTDRSARATHERLAFGGLPT
jgi:cation/acetate symporter